MLFNQYSLITLKFLINQFLVIYLCLNFRLIIINLINLYKLIKLCLIKIRK